MKLRLLSLALCLTVILGLCPTAAFAANGNHSSNSNTVTVSGSATVYVSATNANVYAYYYTDENSSTVDESNFEKLTTKEEVDADGNVTRTGTFYKETFNPYSNVYSAYVLFFVALDDNCLLTQFDTDTGNVGGQNIDDVIDGKAMEGFANIANIASYASENLHAIVVFGNSRSDSSSVEDTITVNAEKGGLDIDAESDSKDVVGAGVTVTFTVTLQPAQLKNIVDPEIDFDLSLSMAVGNGKLGTPSEITYNEKEGNYTATVDYTVSKEDAERGTIVLRAKGTLTYTYTATGNVGNKTVKTTSIYVNSTTESVDISQVFSVTVIGENVNSININDVESNYVETVAKSEVTVNWDVDDGYALDKVTVNDDEVETEGNTLTIDSLEGNKTVKITAAEDKVGKTDTDGKDTGDGISDKYQKKVTFYVVNGTWADNGNDTPKVVYVDLLDENGKYSEEGEGNLTAPEVAEGGSWDYDVPSTINKKGRDTYTYTFVKDDNTNGTTSGGGDTDTDNENGGDTDPDDNTGGTTSGGGDGNSDNKETEIKITPVSITAYVGGSSANGSHAPKLRFSVDLPDDLTLDDLSFDIHEGDNITHLDREILSIYDNKTYCLFPQLANGTSSDGFAGMTSNYLILADEDDNSETYAGTYIIEKNNPNDWYITATAKDGKVYFADIEDGQTVTIRSVSNEVGMYDNNENFLASVNETFILKDYQTGFAAVVDENTKFRTNGDRSLGVLEFDKDGIGTDNSCTNISLLVDDTVSLNPDVSAETLEGYMLAAAGVEDGWDYQFKYLDLVNTMDGNAVVTVANGDVTVYWPYPEGITFENAGNYDIKIIHYAGMEREYVAQYDDVSNEITIGGKEIVPKEIEATATENGIKFTTNSFSPFVLLWKEKSTGTDNTGGNSGETGDGNGDNSGDKEDPSDGDNTGDKEDPGDGDNTDDKKPGTDDNGKDPDDGDNSGDKEDPNDGDGDGEKEDKDDGNGETGDNSDDTAEVTLTIVYDTVWDMFHNLGMAQDGIENGYMTVEKGKSIQLKDIDVPDGISVSAWYWSYGFDDVDKITDSAILMDSDKKIYAGTTTSGSATTPQDAEDKKDDNKDDGSGDGSKDDDKTTPTTPTTPSDTTPAETQDKDTEGENTGDKGSSGSTVPDGLNGDDHIAYVSGYPDGSVQPKSSVTRAEVAMMLYRLLTDERRNELNPENDVFSDVPEDAWYRSAVNAMADGGYITGYPDGTFRGNDEISRAEFVAVMVRFLGKTEASCSFTDVKPGYWAYSSIAQATTAGWIEGYPDGTFAPANDITRAEAMRIINRVLNRGVDENSELLAFRAWPDNTDKSAWFYYDVIEATNAHTYSGSRPSEQWESLS